jgi:hypothetical protein
MKDIKKVGILPLSRPTFDVPFAEQNLEAMILALRAAGYSIAGQEKLLFDADSTRSAIAELTQQKPDTILVLQVTFTDAAMAVEIANAFDKPLLIWAIPEPRIGGRLRLNSFCGLNLAGHALGRNGREFGYLYAAPESSGIEQGLRELLEGRRMAEAVAPVASEAPSGEDAQKGIAAASALRGTRIGRIGAHPDGFDTCAYDKQTLQALASVDVDELDLGALFDRAKSIGDERELGVRAQVEQILSGLDSVDQAQLDRSLRLKSALDDLRNEGGYDAFAIRCWPETFTEYGGAVCGPVSMMGEARVPCACEADVYGALTTLLLQRVADQPAFLVDLVDLDKFDDTGVVWHCGQAPISMADPDSHPYATIHTNRKMPLLFEFPLKPGRVTFFRISQARGKTFAVIGGGEMLQRPMAFTGTSGVVHFDSGSETTLERVMGAALEHHMALTYGDHRNALKAAASALDLPVLEL